MSNVLVVVEQSAGQLRKVSLPAITWGQQVAAKSGGQCYLLLLGHNVSKPLEDLSHFGAARVYGIEHANYEHYLTESWTQAVAHVAQLCQATYIGSASSGCSKDFLPRLACRLQAGMASDVMAVVDAQTFKRPMWAGNVIATVQLSSKIKVCSVRATEFAPPPSQDSKSPLEMVQVPVDLQALKSQFVRLNVVQSARPDVTSAARVVSGGRGVKGPEGFKVIEALADALQAGVGASRAVCDAGWVANDLQIGQTGKIVAPDLYIAVGISGAIQHLAGMKGSKTIVAINKDPEAPIFQVADYGLVADLFTAVPELTRQVGH